MHLHIAEVIETPNLNLLDAQFLILNSWSGRPDLNRHQEGGNLPSYQLDDARKLLNYGAIGGPRTLNLPLTRRLLCQIELRWRGNYYVINSF